jgi:hypothetical protein
MRPRYRWDTISGVPERPAFPGEPILEEAGLTWLGQITPKKRN